MAKKQAKKDLFKYLPFVAVACAVLAVVFFLLPFVGGEGKVLSQVYTGTLNGFEVAFGGSNPLSYVNEEGETVNAALLVISSKSVALVAIAFILAVLGVGVTGTSITSEKKYKKIVNIVGLALLALAGIFCLISKNSFILTNELGDSQEYYSMGIGAILSGVFALLGAGAQALRVIKE